MSWRAPWYKGHAKRVAKPGKKKPRVVLPKPTRPRPTLCECCGTVPRGAVKALALDHNHVTGEFRGWLCSFCNLAIGMLGDNVAGLKKAIDYLQRVDPNGS